MLIRSQDKHILINMNNVSSLEVGDDGLRIFADDGTSIHEIGKYLNEEKNIKVLDMIQEAYCEFMALRNYDMWYGKESVFQMPADSEVRV